MSLQPISHKPITRPSGSCTQRHFCCRLRPQPWCVDMLQPTLELLINISRINVIVFFRRWRWTWTMMC